MEKTFWYEMEKNFDIKWGRLYLKSTSTTGSEILHLWFFLFRKLS